MVPQKWAHGQTDGHTDTRTRRQAFWLIESIDPEGRCFENMNEGRWYLSALYMVSYLEISFLCWELILQRKERQYDRDKDFSEYFQNKTCLNCSPRLLSGGPWVQWSLAAPQFSSFSSPLSVFFLMKIEFWVNFWMIGEGSERQTERHTHQYHDLAWPKGQAEWKYAIVLFLNFYSLK